MHNIMKKTKFDFHYDYVILKIPACLYECMDFVLWFNYLCEKSNLTQKKKDCCDLFMYKV